MSDKTFTVIIVDDEPHAIRTLSAQLEWTHLPVKIIDTANSVEEAEVALRKRKPDFIFLDIKMPGKEGFELFDAIDLKVSEVIFTTAHDSYALKAFKLQASGYLMKPVSTKELKSLLTRLMEKRGMSADEHQDLIIDEKSGILKLPLKSILYVSSIGSYSHIHFDDNTEKVVNTNLKILEGKLAKKGFFRLHNQFLVNGSIITHIVKSRNAHAVLKNGKELPISRAKKVLFYAFFEALNKD